MKLKRRHSTNFNIFYVVLTIFIGSIVVGQEDKFGARLTQTEAAAVLASVGFPNPIVPIMTCLAQHESSFRTRILNHNTNATIDYGFMQVNTIWLRACQATEKSILDVYVNAKCSLLVYQRQGLTAWVTFNKFREKCLAYTVKDMPVNSMVQNYIAFQKTQEL